MARLARSNFVKACRDKRGVARGEPDAADNGGAVFRPLEVRCIDLDDLLF